MTKDVPLVMYVIRFSGVYALAMLAFAVVSSVIDFSGNTGTNVAMLIASTYYVSSTFVVENRRVFSKTELHGLAKLSVAASIGVSLVLGSIILAISEDGASLVGLLMAGLQNNALIFMAIIAIALLIEYGLIRFSYRWIASFLLKQHERKNTA